MDAPMHSVSYKVKYFTQEMIQGICSMDDFYRETGLLKLLESGEVVNVNQLWMNREQCEGLQDIVTKNLRKGRFKRTSQKVLDYSVAMDWLNYSPVSIPYVPEGEIWVFQKEDTDAAMNEYRNWYRENMMGLTEEEGV